MSGLAPKFPLEVDDLDGAYALVKDFRSLVKQNFKNLLLTSPGERIMDPNFGVGIRNYLFENFEIQRFRSRIITDITNQASIYMPFISIEDINIINPGPNSVSIEIGFIIEPLNVRDVLVQPIIEG